MPQLSHPPRVILAGMTRQQPQPGSQRAVTEAQLEVPRGEERGREDRPPGIGERLAAIQRAPLRTAPGEQWHYSSPGFLLVGLIVERASGQPYAEFLTERILSPLRLTATTVGGRPPAWPPAATGLASQCRPSTWTRCRAPATSGRPRPT